MAFNFDLRVDRSHSDSTKWHKYRDRDVIPLWVADTDFLSPPAVIEALQQRVAHGVFGYGTPPPELTGLIVERMRSRYQWAIRPEWIVYLPGLVCGLNLAMRAFTEPHQAAIIPTPLYPPFAEAANYAGRHVYSAPLHDEGNRLRLDLTAAEPALNGDQALLFLCNPHNPGGTVYRRDELEQQHAFAQRHDLVVCSDEIHCDLILEPGCRHIPFASLNPDAEQRTLTLMAPSKTFNLAGLGASFAIIANPALRHRFKQQRRGVVPHVDILAYVAATAAYRDGEAWLAAQLDYLRDNRDLVMARINALPGLRMLPLEATYLAWIDASALPVESPYHFFLAAGVGLTDGAGFGDARFVRLNFGCPRALLDEALTRIERAVAAL
ncbi:aspartate aminotransferase [Chimaeribacter coloradensis]|uniref:cysteine-S-conjugate beta-lyase n=1 Tax=Chimaeribacter coloradensis TaxID=2060068 RepID=A0A2N5EAN9_9GAMM|nr:PatB family C-S lyase [Chimaeribacter coloradensis]PLR39164.1 aspartate aminotransferase [Chimaeribacter coloradensis]